MTKSKVGAIALAAFVMAWLFSSLLMASSPTKIFIMKDPLGDDYGYGEYVYPLSNSYVKGCLDLTGFEVLLNSDRVIFEINLSHLGGNPLNLSNGFSLQEIQIYVHAGNSYVGRTDTLGLNVWIRNIDSWQFMILVNGLKPSKSKFLSGTPTSIILYYNGSLRDSFKIGVMNNSIIVSVPKALIPSQWLNNVKEWRYVVALTPFDINNPYGVMTYSVKATNESVGGAAEEAIKAEVQPRLMDLLAPNASVQYQMLSNYNSTTGSLAVIAAVPYLKGYAIPQPPKTVTTTLTTTKTVHETLTKYVYGTETVTKAIIKEYYGVTTWWLIGLSMVLLILLAALMEKERNKQEAT